MRDRILCGSGNYQRRGAEVVHRNKSFIAFTANLKAEEDADVTAHRKILQSIIPPDQSDTQEGLLYYRVS